MFFRPFFTISVLDSATKAQDYKQKNAQKAAAKRVPDEIFLLAKVSRYGCALICVSEALMENLPAQDLPPFVPIFCAVSYRWEAGKGLQAVP